MPRKAPAQTPAVSTSGITNMSQARPKGKVTPLKVKPQGEHGGMIHSQLEIQCPLCCEEMDSTDMEFIPCPCGFKVCLFCYQRVQNDCNNLCPGCRRPYGSEIEHFETEQNNGISGMEHLRLPAPREQLVPQQRTLVERQPAPAQQQQVPVAANGTPQRKPLESASRTPVQQHVFNDSAPVGLPPAASWATAQSLSRTTSLDSESTTMHTSGDDLWPSLAESIPINHSRPHRPASSTSNQIQLMEQDSQSVDMEESQESFKSTAQVMSMVSGVRRAVCVPLSLAARAVAPYPEATTILTEVKQAVRTGRMSSRDGAAQLVALIKEKEYVRPRSSLSGRTPPGFSDPLYRNSASSPLFSSTMDGSTTSSAASSPFSQVPQNGYGTAFMSQQSAFGSSVHTSPSVWTDSGLPGVSFSMGMAPSVPRNVQALWHDPANTAQAESQTAFGSSASSAGYGSWNSSLYSPSDAPVSRYIPPGIGSSAKASNVPAYKPLSLMSNGY